MPRAHVALLVVALVGLPPVGHVTLHGQTAPGAASGADASRPNSFDPDLERIREGLARGEPLDLDLPAETATFRMEIEGTLPDISTWLGDMRALHAGPVVMSPYHAEFLRMVTPPDIRASLTNGEVAQLLATGVAGGLALRQVFAALGSALAAGRSVRACDLVRQDLIDLNIARARQGLLPVNLPACR
jgi:hypothetical protein